MSNRDRLINGSALRVIESVDGHCAESVFPGRPDGG